MACNKNRYTPVSTIIKKSIDLGIMKYNNEGSLSKIKK